MDGNWVGRHFNYHQQLGWLEILCDPKCQLLSILTCFFFHVGNRQAVYNMRSYISKPIWYEWYHFVWLDGHPCTSCFFSILRGNMADFSHQMPSTFLHFHWDLCNRLI